MGEKNMYKQIKSPFKKNIFFIGLLAIMVFGFLPFQAEAQEVTVRQVQSHSIDGRLSSLRKSLFARFDSLVSQIEALQTIVDDNQTFFESVGGTCTTSNPDAVAMVVGLNADGSVKCQDFEHRNVPASVTPPTQPTPSATYVWDAESWGSCSCAGTRTRTVNCINEDTNAVVADNLCDGTKLAESGSCSASSSCRSAPTCVSNNPGGGGAGRTRCDSSMCTLPNGTQWNVGSNVSYGNKTFHCCEPNIYVENHPIMHHCP